MSLAFIDALDDAVGCNLSHDFLYMLEGMTMLLGRKIELTSLPYRLNSCHFFASLLAGKFIPQLNVLILCLCQALP